MNQKKILDWKATNFSGAGYTPLPLQKPIHLSSARVIVVSGGEGSGKSYVTAAEIFARYGLWKLVYIVAPKYEQAHKEMDYLFTWLSVIGATNKNLYSNPSKGKKILQTRDGGHIETLSAEDGPKAITGTGESPDLMAMVEAGKQSYDIYLACRGRVARSRGTLIVSGTIEESERWYPELVNAYQTVNEDNAQSFLLPTWSNTSIYPLGREDPEIKALERLYADQPEKFLERFGGQPCPPSNLMFKNFSYVKHVGNAPYWENNPYWNDRPIQLWVDPGYAGAYAVLPTQTDGTDIWVIDEVYIQYGVASEVIGICQERAWWKQVNFVVMDVAGKAHIGMEAGKATHDEYWRKEARLPVGMKRVLIDDGTQRIHTFLNSPITGAPRIHFDARCKKTAWEFSEGYRRNLDTGKPIDKNNHAIKAVAYGLVYNFGLAEPTVSRLPTRYHGEAMDNALAGVYG